MDTDSVRDENAVDVFLTLANRTDMWDLPIGQGIASTNWQVLVTTGVAPKKTDYGEKPVVGIQELSAMGWNSKKEYEEMSDIMNSVNFALKEYDEVDTEWTRMQDSGLTDMNTPDVRRVSFCGTAKTMT